MEHITNSQLRTLTSRTKFKEGIDSLFAMPKPSPYYSYGSKTGNLYHTQIRTGSLPLNAYLFNQQKLPSPHCKCNHPSETIQHFLLICPLYRQIRQDFFTQLSLVLGPQFTTLPTADLLQTLTHGHNITATRTGGGREVAELFQGFVTRALALRRAAGAAAGAADAHYHCYHCYITVLC